MSNEMEVQGAKAKELLAQKEKLHKFINELTEHDQLMFICKDLSGQKSDHVHVQGPLNDRSLLYGMLEMARDAIQASFNKKS